MLMQLQNHFYDIPTSVQDDTFERSYTKVLILFIVLTAGFFLFIYPYIYKYMILVSCK